MPGSHTEYLDQLWSAYNSRAPGDYTRDVNDIFDKIKADSRSNDDFMATLRSRWNESMKQMDKQAKKAWKRILSDPSYSSQSDKDLIEVVGKIKKDKSLTRGQTDALFTQLKNLRSKRPNVTQLNAFPTFEPNEMSKTMGYNRQSYNPSAFSDEHRQYVDEIINLYKAEKGLADSIFEQALRYSDCDGALQANPFNPHHERRTDYVHPVIAALFLPKIQQIDKRMLLTNLGEIVYKRNEGMAPEDTLPEKEFYDDIIQQYSKSKCDDNAMKDILIRYQVQLSLWKAVLNLREGRFFDPDNTQVIAAINHCKDLDVPDMLGAGDAGDILRKLFAAFAWNPIVVHRSNYLGEFMGSQLRNPYQSGALMNGTIDFVPMVTIYDLPQQKQSFETMLPYSLSDKLESYPYWDPEAEILVPRISKVLMARSMLVFNIQRRFTPFEQILNFKNPVRVRDLPLVNNRREQVNPYPVTVDHRLDLEKEPNTTYELTSAVLYKVYASGNAERGFDTNFYQAGYRSLIMSHLDDDKIEYDPVRATKYQTNHTNDINTHLENLNDLGNVDYHKRAHHYSAVAIADDNNMEGGSTVDGQLAVFSNLLIYTPSEERKLFDQL